MLWPALLSRSFCPRCHGTSTDDGLAFPCVASGLLKPPAPYFQLSLLGDCGKGEPQHLELSRLMGHTTEKQCSKGLTLSYCEMTGQHVFLTKPAPNRTKTRYLLGKLCFPSAGTT